MHGSHGAHRVPLDLLFFRPPPCVARLSPPSPLPSLFPLPRPLAVAPYRHTSPTRRIHHSLLSRVTLYLFKAPGDRPSAVCTESTWRFRWDLAARGGGNSVGAHIHVYGEGERVSDRSVDLHRSILHFRESYYRTSSRFPCLFRFPAGRLHASRRSHRSSSFPPPSFFPALI